MTEQLTPKEILRIAGILNDCFPDLGKKDRRNEATGKLVGFFETQLATIMTRLKDALEQSRKDEDIDLPEDWYGLFYSIRNSGVTKGQAVCLEWVSVGDSLPTGQWNVNHPYLSEEVLIANSCSINIGYYDRNESRWYVDKGAFGKHKERIDKITHWMSLPINPHDQTPTCQGTGKALPDREKIENLADALEEPRVVRLLAEWLAIDHDKTRLQFNEHLEDAQELYDYIIYIIKPIALMKGEIE